MSDTPLVQIENIGFWMAGAATATDEWAGESADMREMLHSLVDDYLDNGGDLSAKLIEKPLPQVMEEILSEARTDLDKYPYAKGG